MTFLISEGATQEPSATTRLAPNQNFEKRFTFEGKAFDASIELLIVSTPGFTHVSYNQNAHENVLRVSRDSEEIVGAVKAFSAGPNVLLAQPSQMKTVSCTGSAVVVLDESVVTKNQSGSDLKISLTGNGDLYLSNDHLSLRSFEFSSSGSGEIQLASSSVVGAEDVNIHAVNASRIEVFTSKLEAMSINLSITGSGDFQIAAPSMGRTDTSSSLVAKEKLSVSVAGAGDLDIFYPNVHVAGLSASVTGSGDVRFAVRNDISVNNLTCNVTDFGGIVIASHEGLCNSQVVSTIGHGQVNTGDVPTVSSNVNIIGNGNVIVQATGAIQANVVGSGAVSYIGEAPASIEGSTTNVKSTTRDPAKTHLGKMTKEKHASRVPEKDAAFSTISVKESSKHVYKVKIRSFSELKDKVCRFFGFGMGSAVAEVEPAGS